MNKKIFIIFISLITVFAVLIFINYRNNKNQEVLKSVVQLDKNSLSEANLSKTNLKESKIAYPITDFEKRITKKPFGIYLTPENSPVQPERFSGYHTGVDVEYSDVVSDVPVYAAYDGQIISSEWVSGYGGTIVLKCNINGEDLYILYGHLNPQSLMPVGSEVKKGQQIAILGQGYSQQTDGERKHLHFAIHKNNLDLKGYVQNQSELSVWYNPIDFYNKINQNS